MITGIIRQLKNIFKKKSNMAEVPKEERIVFPPFELPEFKLGRIMHLESVDQKPTNVKEAQEWGQMLNSYRGNIVAAVISLEKSMMQVILLYLSMKDGIAAHYINEYVLESPNCTTFEKLKILRGLMKDHHLGTPGLSAIEGSSLRGDLQDLIEIRNNFAHGDISISLKDLSSRIIYMKSGKKKANELTTDYFREIISKRDSAFQKLSILITELTKLLRNQDEAIIITPAKE